MNDLSLSCPYCHQFLTHDEVNERIGAVIDDLIDDAEYDARLTALENVEGPVPILDDFVAMRYLPELLDSIFSGDAATALLLLPRVLDIPGVDAKIMQAQARYKAKHRREARDHSRKIQFTEIFNNQQATRIVPVFVGGGTPPASNSY